LPSRSYSLCRPARCAKAKNKKAVAGFLAALDNIEQADLDLYGFYAGL
jgi:hypothetical protein